MDYKEILKGIVNIINTAVKSDIGFVNICSYISKNCPELAESEDEEIRQAMINFFKSERIKDGIAVLHFGVNIEKMISWLEKQGDKPQGKTALEAFNEEKVDNANKVEPKFKVGGWETTVSTDADCQSCYFNSDNTCVRHEQADGCECYYSIEDARMEHQKKMP